MSISHVGLDLLIETSWEVCNKVGGIYTVLSTKAKTLQSMYKDKVIFIGPDVWTSYNESPFFTETPSLMKAWKAKAALPEGVTVRVGRWKVPGRPIAILVKFDSMYAVKDSFYGEMWRHYGVDSLHAYGDYDEACAFSHAAGIVIESLYNYIGGESKKIIAHFDEWTTGMGLLYTKLKMPSIATIFTTHATSIGRSICGNNKPLYDYLKGYNGDQMAEELNMQSKHSLEKAAAHNADCFTTVSDVTAIECEQLLDRRPDVVTPNGFESNFVPAPAKFDKARQTARKKLLEVASALTGNDYSDETFIVGTSGRCEYRNKGIDVFLDSLHRLESCNPCRKVLAFVMVPAWCADVRDDLVSNIKNGTVSCLNNPVITHNLNNPWDDAVSNRIQGLGFHNGPDARVTVIDVPCYLNGNDGVFNTAYYDLLIGFDATVFPSYYEPWGYTPLESVAFGVPTVTTSLSGFGQWVLRRFTNDFEECGVTVINRNDSNYFDVVEQTAEALRFLTCADSSTTKRTHSAAMATASKAEWAYFIKYYIDSFQTALASAKRRMETTNN